MLFVYRKAFDLGASVSFCIHLFLQINIAVRNAAQHVAPLPSRGGLILLQTAHADARQMTAQSNARAAGRRRLRDIHTEQSPVTQQHTAGLSAGCGRLPLDRRPYGF